MLDVKIFKECHDRLKQTTLDYERKTKLLSDLKQRLQEHGEKLKSYRGQYEIQLYNGLDELGVDLLAYHSGTFVGNHLFKMLKITSEIDGPKILTAPLSPAPELHTQFYDLLVLLSGIFK